MSISAEYAIHRAMSEREDFATDAIQGPTVAARYALAVCAEGPGRASKRQPAEQAKRLREWAEILRTAADYLEKGEVFNG